MKKPSRRRFLTGLFAGLGLSVLGAWIFRRPILKKAFMTGDFDPSLLNAAPTAMDDLCVLTSRQVEGPFFFPSPERRDIREDRNGRHLALQFQVINHPDCTPLEGAVVELWHCDAEGVYSGYPSEISHDIWKITLLFANDSKMQNGELHIDPVNDNRFLRGQQRTNAEGWVNFDTIMPGWYEGRVPHIHAKVILATGEQLLTQFYFETDFCNQIYTTEAPYDKYGECPMSHADDNVLEEGETADGLLLKITPINDPNTALQASARIGITNA